MAAQVRLSLHLSKRYIVGNHMSRLNNEIKVTNCTLKSHSCRKKLRFCNYVRNVVMDFIYKVYKVNLMDPISRKMSTLNHFLGNVTVLCVFGLVYNFHARITKRGYVSTASCCLSFVS